MKRFNDFVVKTQVKAERAMKKIGEAMTKKEHGDNQIVVALILIVVAIGLCIVFQNQIRDILTVVGEKVNGAVNNLANFTVK